MMFYLRFRSIVGYSGCFMVDFDTPDLLCLVWEYRFIFSMFYFVSQDIV